MFGTDETTFLSPTGDDKRLQCTCGKTIAVHSVWNHFVTAKFHKLDTEVVESWQAFQDFRSRSSSSTFANFLESWEDWGAERDQDQDGSRDSNDFNEAEEEEEETEDRGSREDDYNEEEEEEGEPEDKQSYDDAEYNEQEEGGEEEPAAGGDDEGKEELSEEYEFLKPSEDGSKLLCACGSRVSQHGFWNHFVKARWHQLQPEDVKQWVSYKDYLNRRKSNTFENFIDWWTNREPDGHEDRGEEDRGAESGDLDPECEGAEDEENQETTDEENATADEYDYLQPSEDDCKLLCKCGRRVSPKSIWNHFVVAKFHQLEPEGVKQWESYKDYLNCKRSKKFTNFLHWWMTWAPEGCQDDAEEDCEEESEGQAPECEDAEDEENQEATSERDDDGFTFDIPNSRQINLSITIRLNEDGKKWAHEDWDETLEYHPWPKMAKGYQVPADVLEDYGIHIKPRARATDRSDKHVQQKITPINHFFQLVQVRPADANILLVLRALQQKKLFDRVMNLPIASTRYSYVASMQPAMTSFCNYLLRRLEGCPEEEEANAKPFVKVVRQLFDAFKDLVPAIKRQQAVRSHAKAARENSYMSEFDSLAEIKQSCTQSFFDMATCNWALEEEFLPTTNWFHIASALMAGLLFNAVPNGRPGEIATFKETEIREVHRNRNEFYERHKHKNDWAQGEVGKYIHQETMGRCMIMYLDLPGRPHLRDPNGKDVPGSFWIHADPSMSKLVNKWCDMHTKDRRTPMRIRKAYNNLSMRTEIRTQTENPLNLAAAARVVNAHQEEMQNSIAYHTEKARHVAMKSKALTHAMFGEDIPWPEESELIPGKFIERAKELAGFSKRKRSTNSRKAVGGDCEAEGVGEESEPGIADGQELGLDETFEEDLGLEQRATDGPETRPVNFATKQAGNARAVAEITVAGKPSTLRAPLVAKSSMQKPSPPASVNAPFLKKLRSSKATTSATQPSTCPHAWLPKGFQEGLQTFLAMEIGGRYSIKVICSSSTRHACVSRK